MTETLGFLMGDCYRLMRRRFDERARTTGATGTQWRTLKLLERHEGINQGKLAELLDVEPITLCRMVDRLEEAGFVERRRDPEDRRAWRIYLTDRARPVLDDLHVVASEMIEAMLHGLGVAQRETLLETLETVRSNLLHGFDIKEAANG